MKNLLIALFTLFSITAYSQQTVDFEKVTGGATMTLNGSLIAFNAPIVTFSNTATAFAFRINDVVYLFKPAVDHITVNGVLMTSQTAAQIVTLLQTTVFNSGSGGGTGLVTYNGSLYDSNTVIGTIYDNSSWSDFSGFTTNAGSPTIVSNKIRFPVGSGGGVSISIPQVGLIEQEQLQVDFKYKTLLSTDSSLQIGWQSVNPITANQLSLFAKLNTASGKVIIIAKLGTSTFSYATASSGMGSISVDDSISLIYYRNHDTSRVTAINRTTAGTSTITLVSDLNAGGSAHFYRQAGQVNISATGQATNTEEICRIWYSSQCPQGSGILVVGNSITAGFFSTDRWMRFGKQAHMIVSGGPNDYSSSVVSRLYEIWHTIKPRNVFVAAGTNDVGFYTTAQTMAYYKQIVDTLALHGIPVYFQLLIPRAGTNVTLINNAIIAAYPNNYIDTYTPMVFNGTYPNPAYYVSDSIHPNLAGHTVMANAITSSAIYTRLASQYYYKYASPAAPLDDSLAFATRAFAQLLYRFAIQYPITGSGGANQIPVFTNSSNLTSTAFTIVDPTTGLMTLSHTVGTSDGLILNGSNGGRHGLQTANSNSAGFSGVLNTNDRGTATNVGSMAIVGSTSIQFDGVFGITHPVDYTFLYTNGTNAAGLAIGNVTSKPLILATNNLNRINITGGGNVLINTTTDNSTLTINGSTAHAYRAITAIRTLDATDYLINCTSNSFTVTLPTAVGITGRQYIIKNTGSSTTITIATTSSQTVDGSSPGTVTTLVPLRVMSDGANWITW